jgi:murein L,D-transpeptidase YcbB/YkuD
MNKNENLKMEVNHIFQHNIYVKEMRFTEANQTYCGHHHDYDHVTMVAAGRVRVKFSAVPEVGIQEETKEYEAVSTFVTRSFREHEITALTPDTVVCCIHAVRDASGDIIVPEAPEDKKHDPDHKFHGWGEISRIVGKKTGRMAFTASEKDKDRMFKRAEKEGTLKPGSGDMLINED